MLPSVFVSHVESFFINCEIDCIKTKEFQNLPISQSWCIFNYINVIVNCFRLTETLEDIIINVITLTSSEDQNVFTKQFYYPFLHRIIRWLNEAKIRPSSTNDFVRSGSIAGIRGSTAREADKLRSLFRNFASNHQQRRNTASEPGIEAGIPTNFGRKKRSWKRQVYEQF